MIKTKVSRGQSLTSEEDVRLVPQLPLHQAQNQLPYAPLTAPTPPKLPPNEPLPQDSTKWVAKKKKEELTPSIASLFRTPGDPQRPTHSNHAGNQGTDSKGTDPTSNPSAPLTIGSLRNMLKEATSDIKCYVAEEISKNLAGLRADVKALNSGTDQTEVRIKTLTAASTSQSQEISYLHGRLTAMEDSLEDLNNRSWRNNIRLCGLPEAVQPEALITTLKSIFSAMAPELPLTLLEMDRAHRALRPPNLNLSTPRDVIIRLHYFQTKEKLMQLARDRPPKYKDTSLTFFQDLAPTTLKKRRDLKPLTLALHLTPIT
ncbi:Hypothetical predicted protein [Pelobates cultripes]|uniref:Uncharacterized protein n=1 Tax=Pelobates cultripes TaxID=61616 RepID=A0AAD1R6P5_PELCU|nr:Hypothetical predicted protein [Pelobates cultripes]